MSNYEQRVIVRKATSNHLPPKQKEEKQPPKERPKRYGKRPHTVRDKTIIADHQKNDTAVLYVIEESTKALLPIVADVPRDKVKATARLIATLMETYEKIAENGKMVLSLTVDR